MPLSGKELIKIFKQKGFKIIKKQGKGSHTKLRKGKKTIIIPGHRELKKGTEKALLRELEETE